jgi:hypothetical protein
MADKGGISNGKQGRSRRGFVLDVCGHTSVRVVPGSESLRLLKIRSCDLPCRFRFLVRPTQIKVSLASRECACRGDADLGRASLHRGRCPSIPQIRFSPPDRVVQASQYTFTFRLSSPGLSTLSKAPGRPAYVHRPVRTIPETCHCLRSCASNETGRIESRCARAIAERVGELIAGSQPPEGPEADTSNNHPICSVNSSVPFVRAVPQANRELL